MRNTSKPKRQHPPALPRNMGEQHRPYIEALHEVSEVSDLFQKLSDLPAMDCRLDPEASILFRELEQFALVQTRLQKNPQTFGAWLSLPEAAAEAALSLHTINALYSGDSVPPEISRATLESGIKVAYRNLASQHRLAPLGNLLERA